MHPLLHFLAQVSTSTTKAKSTKSSSSSVYTLLFFVVVIGAVYLLFMRPRQQRMKQQQAARTQLQVGDLVLSAGGIQGTLVALDDDVAEVEVAPGMVLTFLRRAISAHPGGRPATEAAAAAQPVDEEWDIPASTEDEHPGDAWELPPSAEDEHRGDEPTGRSGDRGRDDHPAGPAEHRNGTSDPPSGGGGPPEPGEHPDRTS
jgi:preprotein translocase subunit YajC